MKYLLMLIVALLLIYPTWAQEDTPTASAESVTQAPMAVVTEEVPNTGDVIVNAGGENSVTSAVVLILGVLATGMIAVSLGLQVIGNRAKQISDNPVAVAALEQGYGSLPDVIKAATTPIKESLERSDAALKSVIELVKKLTDNVPESEKVNPDRIIPGDDMTP